MAGTMSGSSEGSNMGKSGLLTVDVLTAAYLAATAIIALISRTETGLWLAALHLLGIGLVLGERGGVRGHGGSKAAR